MAGANSIFDGDKLLTTPNNERNEDLQMFETLGLRSRPAFLPYSAGAASSNGSCGGSSCSDSGASDQRVAMQA
jgi:biotin synthase